MSDAGAILVAGRTGQLARCLRECADRRAGRAVALGRPELDLAESASVERAVASLAPSAIVNAAAFTAVDGAESEPERAFAVNCEGAARLAGVAARRRIPFVHISTDYVFDGGKPSAYTEDDTPAPVNVYGRSKLAGEEAVRDANPHAVVIRTSWIYSPYGHNFLNTMLRLANTHRVVRVVDDQLGTPTSAAQLATAVLDVVDQLVSAQHAGAAGIYHLAARGETSWHGFAAAIFAGWASRGRKVPSLQAITTADYPTPARRPANSRLDSSRVERVFGIRLAPWQPALEDCLDQLSEEDIRQ